MAKTTRASDSSKVYTDPVHSSTAAGKER